MKSKFSKPTLYRFLLLVIGLGLPFSALAAPKKCEELMSKAAVQGGKEEFYRLSSPVVIHGNVMKFLRTIDVFSQTTHPMSIGLHKEVFASEFKMVYDLMVQLVALDQTLRFPTAGLAYKYLDILLIALDEFKPSHPAYQFVRELTYLKLEFLKADLERPKNGRLN